jgi:hypothetical protein
VRNIYLVVSDIEAARRHLLERGVEVGEIRHKTPIGAWNGGFAQGLDPARGDYASFANFSDPDGNTWGATRTGLPQCVTRKSRRDTSGQQIQRLISLMNAPGRRAPE